MNFPEETLIKISDSLEEVSAVWRGPALRLALTFSLGNAIRIAPKTRRRRKRRKNPSLLFCAA